MNMELPTESPTALGENRLLQDLRQLPDNEVTLVLGTWSRGVLCGCQGYLACLFTLLSVASFVGRAIPLRQSRRGGGGGA